MPKKPNYASLFTLRKDGRYQASFSDERGRHYLYDRDPERLWHRLNDKPEIAEITFDAVAERWEGEHREEITARTWANYAPHYADIVARYKGRPFSAVTSLEIVNHLTAAKARGYSRTVVNTIRSLYRMIFDFAVVQSYAQYNPVVSIKLPKGLKAGQRLAPTDEQIRKICQNVDAPFGLFPFFLLCTGLRKSEALALQWADVDLAAQEIRVTKSIDYTNGAAPKYKPPKTAAGNRTVPIIDVLSGLLRAAYASRRSDLLFPAPPSNRGGTGGGLMTERGYEGLWQRYCAAAGLLEHGRPVITAHHLRHGTATLMFELGVDELTAQRILGHSRVEITREIYTNLRSKQNEKSIRKFNAGMSAYLQNGANREPPETAE